MKKEEVFIYKIATNWDWYLLLNSRDIELHYPIIYDYDMFKNEILEDLEEFPSEEDFEVFKSSVSVKEKLIHYIISWYCGYNSGLFIINHKEEVYFIIDYDLDDEYIQHLNESETDALLNEIINELGFEAAFNETQKYYLEHNNEMVEEFKKIEDYYSHPLLQPLYNKSQRYGSILNDVIKKQ